MLSFSRARATRSALSGSYLSMSSSSTTEPSADRRKELHESLRNIRSRVKTCSLPNKLPTLVAVSKYKPPSDILGCYQEGHLDFGENYVQELERKASTVRVPR